MNLYNIAAKYIDAFEFLSGSDELPEDVIRDTLEAIEGEFEAKAINIASFIKNLEADVDVISAAIEKLYDRREKIEKKAAALKEYLKKNMERINLLSIRSSFFDLKIKKNPATLLIENESLIPKEYKEEKVITKIKTAELKQALKSKPIPGAKFLSFTRLEIK